MGVFASLGHQILRLSTPPRPLSPNRSYLHASRQSESPSNSLPLRAEAHSHLVATCILHPSSHLRHRLFVDRNRLLPIRRRESQSQTRSISTLLPPLLRRNVQLHHQLPALDIRHVGCHALDVVLPPPGRWKVEQNRWSDVRYCGGKYRGLAVQRIAWSTAGGGAAVRQRKGEGREGKVGVVGSESSEKLCLRCSRWRQLSSQSRHSSCPSFADHDVRRSR